MKRLPLLAGLLAAAGAAALIARHGRADRERLTLHYEDGSHVSLGGGAPDAARVLAAAREALPATR